MKPFQGPKQQLQSSISSCFKFICIFYLAIRVEHPYYESLKFEMLQNPRTF